MRLIVFHDEPSRIVMSQSRHWGSRVLRRWPGTPGSDEASPYQVLRRLASRHSGDTGGTPMILFARSEGHARHQAQGIIGVPACVPGFHQGRPSEPERRIWPAEPVAAIQSWSRQEIDKFALLEGINSEANEYLTMTLQNENEQTFNVPKERITCIGSVRPATR
jgi:hypothetical protein